MHMHYLQSHYLNIINIESFGSTLLITYWNYKSQNCMFIFVHYVPNQTLKWTIPVLTS